MKKILLNLSVACVVLISTSFVSNYQEAATRDNNLLMGNPSNAVKQLTSTDNYLIEKDQYVLSYNSKKGTANWVSWHLSMAWKGNYKRTNPFKPDKQVPKKWYRAKTKDYTNTGFNRGHLCPSDDRDGSKTDNDVTFHMSNIIPQSPVCNKETWGDLEDYCRKLADRGNELYIIAGPHGKGGEGECGTSSAIADDKIIVPKYVWKVILILPNGSDDINRVKKSTRVIAVKMPNKQNVNTKKWYNYRVSVDQIEHLTGYNFFSEVKDSIEDDIEASVDDEEIE